MRKKKWIKSEKNQLNMDQKKKPNLKSEMQKTISEMLKCLEENIMNIIQEIRMDKSFLNRHQKQRK